MVEVNPEFLSVKQAMVLLGVSRVTLHRWRLERRIVPHKVGRRVLYLRSEVLAAVAGLHNASAGPASSKPVSRRRRSAVKSAR